MRDPDARIDREERCGIAQGYYMSDTGRGQSGNAICWALAALFAAMPLWAETAEGWFRPNVPLPTGCCLHDVFVVDSEYVWAVGDSGVILRTTEGAESGPHSWQVQQAPYAGTLWTAHFADRSRGWAVGDGGTILHTDWSGDVWEKQVSGTNVGLRDVYFHDGNTGWAVGDLGTVLRTTDGGSQWNTVQPPTEWGLWGVCFLDANNGWVVGEGGTVLRTLDGGATWREQVSGTGLDLRAVHFVDIHTGWAVGHYGTVLHTTDGGRNWDLQPSPVAGTLDSVYLSDVWFADRDRGWVTAVRVLPLQYAGYGPTVQSDHGFIFYTDNGGANWTTRYADSSSGLWGICFDGGEGYAVGEAGTIMYTNGAQQWINLGNCTTPIGPLILAVDFVDRRQGWCTAMSSTGIPSILHSVNAGTTWVEQYPSGSGGTVGSKSTAIFFLDANHGWATGMPMLRTADGGTTWEECTSPRENPLHDVVFVDSVNGWAVGSGWAVGHTGIYRSRDGGRTWEPQYSDAVSEPVLRRIDLQGVSFADTSYGWAVGLWQSIDTVSGAQEEYRIVHTCDGGVHWQFQDTAARPSGPLYAVCCVDRATAWAAGHGGVFHTSDTGRTWVHQTERTETLLGVHFVNRRAGWAVGQGIVMHTADGGQHWEEQNGGPQNAEFSDVDFVDSTCGWVVGQPGLVLATITGGGTPAVGSTKESAGGTRPQSAGSGCSLEVGPGATLRYTLPYEGEARIVVCNIRGRVLRRWRPLRQDAGAYWFAWHEQGCKPSVGIYYAVLHFQRAGAAVQRAVTPVSVR